MASDDTALDTRALDLAAAFTRLFSGVAGQRTVPPYESFYAHDSGRLFQEPAEKSAETLAALGTRVSESFSEPADHVAVQLAIMAELVRRGGPRLKNLADQRRFLDRRLLSWVSDFRDACAEFDRSGFYAAAADSLVAFLRGDARHLVRRDQ